MGDCLTDAEKGSGATRRRALCRRRGISGGENGRAAVQCNMADVSAIGFGDDRKPGEAATPGSSARSASQGASVRAIIVAPNASTRFGGEAILPWHYFRKLKERGVDAHLVVHERTRAELLALAPQCAEYMHFADDRMLSRGLEAIAQHLPHGINGLSTWPLMGVLSGVDERRIVRRLVREAPGLAVVHEPTPVSPRHPSLMVKLGAPLVVGPMNGGMEYPPHFRGEVDRGELLLRRLTRAAASVANRLVPGKRRAALLLVANDRTARALPRSVQGRQVALLAENGVDLTVFQASRSAQAEPPRFAFVGRLVDWKRLDLLLEALSRSPRTYRLEVIGDGPMRQSWQQACEALGMGDRVRFHGFLSQQECAAELATCRALVLPSVYECGGAVVLEAMATGIPVIAADWGGPADYVVHGETGFLVPPTTPELFVTGLADAMLRLGEDRRLAARMGAAGRVRVEREFDWERKVDAILAVYQQVIADSRPSNGSSHAEQQDRGRTRDT